VRDFQQASGIGVDGVVGHDTMDELDTHFVFSAPVPAPSCLQPGNQRTVSLQPVFFRSSTVDPSPTGQSWAGRFLQSNAIWNKLGVIFTARSPVTLTDPANKTAGGTLAEYHRIRSRRRGSGIEVFLVDNDMNFLGGGGTVDGGTANAQIVMSDRGTSNTLLAHELGHVLGLDHPPGGGENNTIMEPSGSHSSPNPTRNTMCNYARITFPSRGPETCLLPDP
jgi:hypothetical protein